MNTTITQIENCDMCKKYTKCIIHSKFPTCTHKIDSMFIITKRNGVWKFVISRDYFCCDCRTIVMSEAAYKIFGMTKAKEQRREEHKKFVIEYGKKILVCKKRAEN